jgi:hypothetical protein
MKYSGCAVIVYRPVSLPLDSLIFSPLHDFLCLPLCLSYSRNLLLKNTKRPRVAIPARVSRALVRSSNGLKRKPSPWSASKSSEQRGSMSSLPSVPGFFHCSSRYIVRYDDLNYPQLTLFTDVDLERGMKQFQYYANRLRKV